MTEIFSSGTKNPKQTDTQTILRPYAEKRMIW